MALRGITVVSLEQAVAAPLATARLADAGARVIKVEREGTGDFARHYDRAVHGESTYFTWLNRGKESVALDLKRAADMRALRRIVAKSDVFVQNLGFGAADRLGLGAEALTGEFKHLITMDISGYGDSGPKASLPAYDLLVQAESGLCSISGPPGTPARIGVSIVDISAGLNAHGAIMQALFERERTGRGQALKTSLFAAASELMAVPYLQTKYTSTVPINIGLAHPSIAPYGAFPCSDGKHILLSIQNEREWERLCTVALGRPDMATDERYNEPNNRVENRSALDAEIAEITSTFSRDEMMERLQQAKVACGAVNGVDDLIVHPQLRTVEVPLASSTNVATVVAPPVWLFGAPTSGTQMGAVPTIGQHTEAILAEFSDD
eukprot:m.219357 g.219357  ORF g.219357 m.219357 type:complete len:380 (-) comp15580_c0_seq1:1054-2193(-)